jgi:endonuclease/exonuclease/phosphatase family metal-dependent hydrolase
MAAALQACRVVDDAPGLAEASDHMPLLAVFNMEHNE